jgi:hypothetical protein
VAIVEVSSQGDDFARKAQNCADFGVFLGDVADDNLMVTREDQVVKNSDLVLARERIRINSCDTIAAPLLRKRSAPRR